MRRPSILLALPLIAGACHRAPPGVNGASEGAFRRGDTVVVERAAAEFFEARVLAVNGAKLKVQTAAEGEPAVVAAGDAYPVPGARHTFMPRQPAICRTDHEHWEPCRIVTGEGSLLLVELGSGEQQPRSRADVLAPSPVTALDIERYFEVRSTRTAFKNAALGAGQPRRPSGWVPVQHEPVLARRRLDWYSAHALSALGDGGVKVVWDGSEHPESLPGTYVVPAPPFAHSFTRGDYALMRPDSPGQPWERVRIDALGEDDAVVVGSDGIRRRVQPRALAPLEGTP